MLSQIIPAVAEVVSRNNPLDTFTGRQKRDPDCRTRGRLATPTRPGPGLASHRPNTDFRLAIQAGLRFKREERARDGRKAIDEYEAQVRAVREKTAPLKALRVAKHARGQSEEPLAKPAERRQGAATNDSF
jgi:hypothetical protein